MEDLVPLVLRAAGRKTAQSNTAESGNLLDKWPFMHCPCMKYGKTLTGPKNRDKDSAIHVHWGWGNCAEEFILVSIRNVWPNRFVQRNSEEEQQSSNSEGLFSFCWYQINNSITPWYPSQRDYFLLLEAVISQPVCYWSLSLSSYQAASRSANLLSNGANYSPSQGHARLAFATLHGTEMSISDPLVDESPSHLKRIATAEVHWWCPALSALEVYWQVRKALTPMKGNLLQDIN